MKKKGMFFPDVLFCFVLLVTILILAFAVVFDNLNQAKNEIAVLQGEVDSLQNQVSGARTKALFWENSFHRFYKYVKQENLPAYEEYAVKAMLYSEYESYYPETWSKESRSGWAVMIRGTTIRSQIAKFNQSTLQDPDLGF